MLVYLVADVSRRVVSAHQERPARRHERVGSPQTTHRRTASQFAGGGRLVRCSSPIGISHDAAFARLQTDG